MDALFSSRDNEEDYYSILGCTELSSQEQIDTEFKVRARECHPDKITDHELKLRAEETFMKINKAHTILKDPVTREAYNTWKKTGLAMSFEHFLEMQSRHKSTFHFASEKPQPSITDQKMVDKATNSSSKATGSTSSNPLNEFRKGSGNHGNLLSQFRSYKL